MSFNIFNATTGEIVQTVEANSAIDAMAKSGYTMPTYVARVAMESQIVTLDLSKWTRLKEVQAYADKRGIELSDAIRELVEDHGLADLAMWFGGGK